MGEEEDGQGHSSCPERDLPLGCWHNIFRFLDPPDIARAAASNRTCRTASYDSRLWSPHFKKAWSPEYCGPLQTPGDHKNYRSLYDQWLTGGPVAVELIPQVHGAGEDDLAARVNKVQLSQAGGLAAWSAGQDGALVGVDVTTCKILKKVWRPTICEDGLKGLTVLDSKGLVVCVGGSYITGWDARVEGKGSSSNPVCSIKTDDPNLGTITHAGSPDGDGPPQVLTGSRDPAVCLWDLRYIEHGPVRRYISNASSYGYCSLARTRTGAILAGGGNSIACWEFETGAPLPTLEFDLLGYGLYQTFISLAVGRDCILARADEYGPVLKWAIPQPGAAASEGGTGPHTIYDVDEFVTCMQGLGEGPDRVLAGTLFGTVCVLECVEESKEMRPCSFLNNLTGPPGMVTSLAAVDQVVVNGFCNGGLQIMRADTHLGPT